MHRTSPARRGPSRAARTIKVAPVTVAIRHALAASVAALALAGPGVAFASGPACVQPACNPVLTNEARIPVQDLTRIALPAARTTQPLSASPTSAALAAGVYGNQAGDLDIQNSDDLTVNGGSDDAAGISATSGGITTVGNTGAIDARSSAATADGIFATGTQVDVTNTGDIFALGYSWAAGIEAQGDLTTVTNSGQLTAVSQGDNGVAFGVYATGGAGLATVDNSGTIYAYAVGRGYTNAVGIAVTGDTGGVSIDNTGDIHAVGYYASGIDVTSNGAVDIHNDGALTIGNVNYTAVATGIHAATGYDGANITIDNTGTIEADAYYIATGIEAVATGLGSTVAITSSGDVSVATLYPYLTTTGIVASADSNATVTNTGSVTLDAGGDADGIVATSVGGIASVVNGGDVTITSAGTQAYVNGLVANSQAGTGSVYNAGTVQVSGQYVASGVDAHGLYGADLHNVGVLDVNAAYAYGAKVTAGLGDAHVGNDVGAAINAYGQLGVGVFATATQGDVVVENAGTIQAVGLSTAFGDYERVTEGNASLDNSGSVYAISLYSATGARVRADLGDVSIDNSGLVYAYSVNANAIGLAGYASGAATVANAGDIYAVSEYGSAFGVRGQADTFDVTNAGAITVAAPTTALGVQALGRDVSVTNSGSITTMGATSVGAYVYAGEGASLVNSGDISASGTSAFGAQLISYGSLDLQNSGTILATGDAIGTGLFAYAYDVATVANTGDVQAQATAGNATGIEVLARTVSLQNGGGIVSIGDAGATGISANGYSVTALNTGDVAAQSANGIAAGIASQAAGDLAIENRGDVSAAGLYGVGVSAYSTGTTSILNTAAGTVSAQGDQAVGIGVLGAGAITVDNRGGVSAQGDTSATGMLVAGLGDASIINSGTVAGQSGGAEAVGIYATAAGNLVVDNRGTINAINDTYAVAVDFGSAGTLVNSGTVRTETAVDGAVAVRGNDDVQAIQNIGLITGAVVTNGGDDIFANNAGGRWVVGNDITDFGDGNDRLTNAAGATITLQDGGIHFGSSTTGNAFTNAGTLRVAGMGLVDMGTDASAAANALAFANNGVIDMVDGAADDVLTLNGSLSGTGNLNLDMDMAGTQTDRLVVNGDVASGTVQTVNLQFTGLPTTDIAPVEFARVTGDSTAGAFVGGNVVGYTPADFLDLRVGITSTLSSSNATPDIFYVGLDVAGLSSAGALAASLSSGLHSLAASGVGTWRERMGLDPVRDGDTVGLGPWARVFGDRGHVSPENVGGNIGSVGDLRFDQSNHGYEVGFDAHIGRGVHAGILLGKSEATQRMLDGAGRDHLEASTTGLYTSWFGARGSYVDVSYRWMGFDARLGATTGLLSTTGEGHAFNVEAGLGGWGFGGVKVVPQLQYTQTRVGGIDALHGPSAEFVSQGGKSTRGRVGVEFSMPMQAGSVTWTPYGTVSAVREFDGETRYTVNDVYFGTTSTKGTSAMVDLGAAAQFGHIGLAGGVQWTDGGALNDFVGGQVILRYTW